MQFFGKIGRFLDKPFPYEESKIEYYRTIGLISLFVFGFLLLFQPFGISSLKSGLFVICLGFGTVSFIGCALFEFVFGRFTKRGHYTFGIWVIEIIGLLLFISLLNFLFARIVLFGSINWEFLPEMVYGTVSIGIFPVIVLGALAVSRVERKYQNIAREISEKGSFLSSVSTSYDRYILNIPVSSIRYVEALQNYVKIGYLKADGDLSELTERATLKSVLEAANGSPIVRCHRSFLVNRESILTVDGNAQGLILSLANCDKQIPVSRSYVNTFRDI